MVPIVAGELIMDRPEWRDMAAHVGTVATQAFQIWLGPDEASLGCNRPGATVSAYLPPFDHLVLDAPDVVGRDWPAPNARYRRVLLRQPRRALAYSG